ncbi:hypothetical protein GUJ93_ZPchr0001g32632 [Zizania palustris]|uniref:RING-CH-type domain-containing protein n=1 Tax=Zizania palustris TaxID=103762 RepID=A0A8J5RCP6_ZIZPA|nr:hypothetical protein GUJ93_ZPchr0001g32632 [Zizania palustris]
MLLSPLSPSLKPVCLKLNRVPQLGARFLLPRTRPRTPRPFGGAMAETSRVGSGSSRNLGVPGRATESWEAEIARGGRPPALCKHDAEIMWVLMGALDVDTVGEGGGEDEPLIQAAECRICQDEDSVKNLEQPCACSGSLKFNPFLLLQQDTPPQRKEVSTFHQKNLMMYQGE